MDVDVPDSAAAVQMDGDVPDTTVAVRMDVDVSDPAAVFQMDGDVSNPDAIVKSIDVCIYVYTAVSSSLYFEIIVQSVGNCS